MDFKDLPNLIPIFPLKGALLLPQGELPLNIFEPRYLAMTRTALAGDRIIGMIQPKNDDELFTVGCAGKISSFHETNDDRFLISLTGLYRFRLQNKTKTPDGFYQARVDWTGYEEDTNTDNIDDLVKRDLFMPKLMDYLSCHDITLDWERVAEVPDRRLLTCIAMVCPFEASEKQALLEAQTLPQRYELMLNLLQMDCKKSGTTSEAQ